MQVIVTGGAGFIGWRPLIARGDALDRRGLRKTA
jgi:nucleoside-diphosphate-sugar epimerase